MSSIHETKEVATLRHYDGIPYVSKENFLLLYPLGREIASGSYGKVYKSGTKYAVKEFLNDPNHIELAVELNMYSSVVHPCILRPICWSSFDKKKYMIMKQGEDLANAIYTKKITIEEVISDTLSAIAFLNSEGIAHGDIKPDNFVYHKGKAKLIDMGLARNTELNNDNDYYMTGVAYTTQYKDPEYSNTQYNNIRCEISALGLTYYRLLTRRNPKFGQLYDYPRSIWPSHINWIINQAAKLVKDRPSINELLNTAPIDLIKRRHIGTIFRESPSEPKVCHEKLPFFLKWLIGVADLFNIKARSLFLTIHLVHRTFDKFKVLYEEDLEKYMNIYGCALMNLAIAATDRFGTITLSDFQYASKSSVKRDEYADMFNQMTIEVLIMLRGLISTLTYWDYAKSKEDLLPLLIDSINCTGNRLIRDVNVGLNKCITVKEFVKPKDFALLASGNMLPIPSDFKVSETKISPCELDTSADVFEIIKLLESGGWSSEDATYSIPIILHNREELKSLSTSEALDIFTELYQDVYGEYVKTFTLDIICKFDWRVYGQQVIDRRLNPFTDWIKQEVGESSEKIPEIDLVSRLKSVVFHA